MASHSNRKRKRGNKRKTKGIENRNERNYHNHGSNRETKDEKKYSKIVEKLRNEQGSNGYCTTYKDHKKSCRGVDWEANEIIDDFLWLGSIKSAKNVSQLFKLGITYILNCADQHSIKGYTGSALNMLCLGAKDKEGYNILDHHLSDAIKFIEKARENQSKILVHCIGGVNRSAAIVVGYLLYLQNDEPSLYDATKMVLEKRPFALTNKSFKRQLLHYERFLHKEISKKYKQRAKNEKKKYNTMQIRNGRRNKRKSNRYIEYQYDNDNDDEEKTET